MSTRRAFRCVPELTSNARILDIGCGTGAQTFVLAESTRAKIVAVDNHAPYVKTLNLRATELDIATRVIASVSDMRQLNFANASFDLIWCEGAVYSIGVSVALLEWRKFLRKEGFIAFTEVCWQQPDPPQECKSFWASEYPAIRSYRALSTEIETCGYELIEHFTLPESAWWDEYYQPLQDSINGFRERYTNDLEAENLCDQCQREIDIWHAYSKFYGYEFFVLRSA